MGGPGISAWQGSAPGGLPATTVTRSENRCFATACGHYCQKDQDVDVLLEAPAVDARRGFTPHEPSGGNPLQRPRPLPLLGGWKVEFAGQRPLRNQAVEWPLPLPLQSSEELAERHRSELGQQGGPMQQHASSALFYLIT